MANRNVQDQGMCGYHSLAQRKWDPAINTKFTPSWDHFNVVSCKGEGLMRVMISAQVGMLTDSIGRKSSLKFTQAGSSYLLYPKK